MVLEREMSMNNMRTKVIKQAAPSGFIFFLAFIGAAIYFIQKSNGTFVEVLVGLLQAIVWPVYVMYNVLTALGA